MSLRRLLDELKHPVSGDAQRPGAPREPLPQGVWMPVLVLVAALGLMVLLSTGDDSLLDTALGPLAALPEAAQDDGAGDPLTPQSEADTYLPVPAILDDERVVAALGPIAKLSCRKDDMAAFEPPAGPASSADPLDRPLTAAGADADSVASEHLLAAAASPIAMVAGARPAAPANAAPASARGAPGAAVVAKADPPSPAAAGSCPALLQRTFNRLQTGKPESLCQFEGKVLLVVNTASYCGYTHQYEGLEAMYRKYKARGLVIVGFPSNDFGKQEPGSNQEIAEFCRSTYGVEFPMFEKSSVTDLASNPLFTELAARTGKSPQWNFHKYVVDRNGQPVASFTSQVEPSDRALVTLIEKLLAERPKG
jgi:glutathione peroxidase